MFRAAQGASIARLLHVRHHHQALRRAACASAGGALVREDEPTAAYVHLPFCKRKCRYCDFPVIAVGMGPPSSGKVDDNMAAYCELLHQEIAASRRLNSTSLRSVFFGGGERGLFSPPAPAPPAPARPRLALRARQPAAVTGASRHACAQAHPRCCALTCWRASCSTWTLPLASRPVPRSASRQTRGRLMRRGCVGT